MTIELVGADHPDAQTVDVWYLERPLGPAEAVTTPPPVPGVLVIEAARPAPHLSKMFYRLVGDPYDWWFRRQWTPEQWADTASRQGVTLHTLWVGGVAAGYHELYDEGDGNIHLDYFGLVSWTHGRGLGRWWLNHAIATAAAHDGATRMHLDTCSTDGPNAKANYLARGFTEFRHEQEHRLTVGS